MRGDRIAKKNIAVGIDSHNFQMIINITRNQKGY